MNLEKKIISGLEKISEVYRILLWEKAKKHRLSPIQIQILLFLKNHNKDLCTISSLSSEFNLTRPTVSDAVKSLFEKKLINKSSSKNDSRSYQIELNLKGRELLNHLSDFAFSIESSLSELQHDELIALYGSISSIIYNLHRNGIISVQRICFSCKYFGNENESFCHLLNVKLGHEDIRLDCDEHIAVG